MSSSWKAEKECGIVPDQWRLETVQVSEMWDSRFDPEPEKLKLLSLKNSIGTIYDIWVKSVD